MSAESLEWLNKYTLVGFTAKRGNTAWHYRSDLQGDESNHYPGAIPVKHVIDRLFNFKVIEAPACFIVPGEIEGAITTYASEGNTFSVISSQSGRKGMLASDNYFDFGAFKDGYQGHDYEEWLLSNVKSILSSDLGIGSAGLLRNRGQAWVSIEMPENVTTKEGVVFRPNLLACTSFDGTIATTYKRVVTDVVCDNTRDMALAEKGQDLRIRHSRYSNLRIGDAREALNIVFSMADDFTQEVARLTKWKVSDKQFENLLNVVVPIPERKGEDTDGRGFTVATKKQDEILTLWRSDDRVTPWKGTAWGVSQAFNTWNQHFAQVRKDAPRVVRNMENLLKDKTFLQDKAILEALETVTK